MVFIILQERVQPRQRRVRWGRAQRQLQDLTSHVQVQPSCHNCLRASCPPNQQLQTWPYRHCRIQPSPSQPSRLKDHGRRLAGHLLPFIDVYFV